MSEVPSTGVSEGAAGASGEDTPAGPAPAAATLAGSPVAPGLVMGPVHRKDYDLDRAAAAPRVPRGGVEVELNRFHGALVAARRQLAELKQRLAGRVPADDARILDTHVAYLKDSVFISDVENLILNEQMALEAAIAKVISDFDRIFRLVQNEALRDRAVDLRDVGIRVLRHLEVESHRGGEAVETPRDYVLAARELSIVDMFNLEGDHVLGIVTEEGGLTSHAAVLARSMRIPTVTAVEGLLDTVREGDWVIVDASEGTVQVNPDEVVRAQYQQEGARPAPAPALEGPELCTRDGAPVALAAACGHLPEVEEALRVGLPAIGVYRTELLYLVDRRPPTAEALAAHYRAVLAAAEGRPVTFRLLHSDSALGLAWLHSQREPNPALGRAGVRALFARESALRVQLQALLLAAGEREVPVLAPFVLDVGDLRRLAEVAFEEQRELGRAGHAAGGKLRFGAVVETPAAALGAEALAREAGSLAVNLAALVQYTLAADRENAELAGLFESPHPAVLRSLVALARAADRHGSSLEVFGATGLGPAWLPFLVGLGATLCVPPGALAGVAQVVRQVDSGRAAADLEAASGCATAGEVASIVAGAGGSRPPAADSR